MLKTAPFYATVPVRDLERARRFYTETLGLGPATPVGPALSFPCGKGTNCLMVKSEAAGTAACAFWQVEDVAAVVEWLREREVEVIEASDSAAWFRDSEGNRMAVMKLAGTQKPPVRRQPAVRREAVEEEAALAA
jgi:predicted enzyme related to lactoylglutathione lyase